MTVRHSARRGSAGKHEINEQNGDYTFVLADSGKTVFKASGGAGETYTIPANSAVPFPIGTMIGIENDGGGTLTVAITTDILEDSSGNTGSQSVSDNGSAVIKKISATKWRFVTGSGGSSTPEYACFYLSGAGATAVSSAATTGTLNATMTNSDATIFSLASSEVTVNKTATFQITADVSIIQGDDGTQTRGTIRVWLEKDSVEITGSRSEFYTRGYGVAGGCSVNAVVSITSGDVIRIRWQRVTNAPDDLDEVTNAIRLSLVELA